MLGRVRPYITCGCSMAASAGHLCHLRTALLRHITSPDNSARSTCHMLDVFHVHDPNVDTRVSGCMWSRGARSIKERQAGLLQQDA